jgi:phospholipid/cholesterol/gamma-HCH transport system substrate-binding protein
MFQKRGIEFAVGLFFLAGIIAFIMLSFKVSGLSNFASGNEGYVLTAEFENVGGLKPRARVSMAGVPIGRVVAIDFDRKYYVAHVRMVLDRKVNNIPNDSTASILTSGLLGDNYISLSPGYSEQFYKPNDNIPVERTTKAIVLEDLVSRFLSTKASGLDSTPSKKDEAAANTKAPNAKPMEVSKQDEPSIKK